MFYNLIYKILISESSKMKKKQNSNTFNFQSSECTTEDEYEEETGVNKIKNHFAIL